MFSNSDAEVMGEKRRVYLQVYHRGGDNDEQREPACTANISSTTQLCMDSLWCRMMCGIEQNKVYIRCMVEEEQHATHGTAHDAWQRSPAY